MACERLSPRNFLTTLVLQISHIDNSGQCAAVHAAVNGHLEALTYLLQMDWQEEEGQVTKMEAMQQSLVVAAAMGHIPVILIVTIQKMTLSHDVESENIITSKY